MHLSSLRDNQDAVAQHGFINQYNFFMGLAHQPEYPGYQDKVDLVLMEAWGWLESAGFLARVPDAASARFFVTRRGLLLKSTEDVAAYRKASPPRRRLTP